MFFTQVAVGSYSMTESGRRRPSRLTLDIAVIVIIISAVIISAFSFWLGVL